MKRRIFLNMIWLTMISLVAISAALCFLFYHQLAKNTRNELRDRGSAYRNMDAETAMRTFPAEPFNLRITLIRPDGTVEYDNAAAANEMENHSAREEVVIALASGDGESRRFSDTLGQETFYYAVRLADNSILRFAKTTSSILGLFLGVVPAVAAAVLLMGIICYWAAGRFTARIVAPLSGIDLSGALAAPYDELAPFIRTIAEQRLHIAKQLSDLQSRSDVISAILSNMNEGILLINPQGEILSANDGVLRLLEKDYPIDGKNILEVLRDVGFSGRVRDALSGKRGELVMELGGRIIRVYFSHVRGGGAIILFLDITEKAKAEKLRRAFSANVSHELKTPLTSIYGNAELLCSGMVKEADRQTFYRQLKEEAGRLIALIEDILMISKLDEGGGQESFEEVALGDVAAEAAEALSRKAEESGVSVRVSGENASMRGNRSLLYEMLYNLIDNAVKYNKPGGTVAVEISGSAGRILISVADGGIGIPKDAQSRVFERFYRADPSRSKKTGGTGLGLAIVKHIVLVHQGEIELHSREQEGTTVTVTFRGA